MDKKDYKYILKRVITFFIIFFILMFFKSCNVHAEVRPIINSGTNVKYYPSGSSNITFSNWYSTNTDTSLTEINFEFETGYTSDGYGGQIQDTLYAGQYLFDFYIETNNLTTHLANCNGSNSDFSFLDITSGNRITNSSYSKSQCIDSYYTTIGGNRAIHYLYSWTISNSTYTYMFDDFRLTIRNWTGTGFTSNNASFMIIVGNLQDYNPVIVQNFTSVAEQQRLNQQSILNATQNAQNIINNQNQNTQDILNSQATINQNINNIGQDTSTIINQQQQNAQQAHQDSQAIKDAMTDTSAPNNLNGLSQSAGWLPPGPVDSILNLPLSLLNNLSDNLSKNCQPVILPIPLVNSNISLPCVKTLYHDMGIDTFINWVGGIVSAFILLSYLLKLYKWVDDTLTFRENHFNDNWGGV